MEGTDVTLKGNENYNLAVFTADGYSYFLYSEKDMSEENFIKIINSMDLTENKRV